jgi:hypothetical protein
MGGGRRTCGFFDKRHEDQTNERITDVSFLNSKRDLLNEEDGDQRDSCDGNDKRKAAFGEV